MCVLDTYKNFIRYTIKFQFSSVAQSYLTLSNPMNHSTPGLPVYHQLPESTNTYSLFFHLFSCSKLGVYWPWPPSRQTTVRFIKPEISVHPFHNFFIPTSCLSSWVAGKGFFWKNSIQGLLWWIRICFAMEETQVRSLVWEDPTCCEQLSPCPTTTEPRTLGPTSHNYWSPCS